MTKAHTPKKAALFGGMFILGMVAMQALLGLFAGLGGQWTQKLIGREWGLVLGPLLILLGLMWPGWLRLPLPSIALRAKRVESGLGAFALGVPFAVAICPACTPALVILLGLVAGVGSPLFGLGLLSAFALGRSVLILLGALAVGWLESLSVLSKYQQAFEIADGVSLMLSGLYMLNAYFIIVPSLAM